MIGIEEVVVRVSERELVSDRWDLVPSVKVPPQVVVGERLDKLSLRLDGPTWQTDTRSALTSLHTMSAST